MKEAVEKIVKALAANVDEVEVSENSDSRSSVIQVRVGEGDMGRIIGREGRTEGDSQSAFLRRTKTGQTVSVGHC